MAQSNSIRQTQGDAMGVLDISIADKKIRINHLYDDIVKTCEKYLSIFAIPDIILYSSNTEIDQFMRKSTIGLLPRNEDCGSNVAITYDYGYYETLLICEKIADCFIEYGILMVHAAAIELNGKGYMFSAHSGIGKTTHVLNWRRMYPNTLIINGDKPFVDIINRKIYGSPWCGKEKLGDNTSASLSGVILLERGLTNCIKPVLFEDTMATFIQHIYIPQQNVKAIKAYRYFYGFKDIHFYKLSCTMNAQSALVAYEGLEIERKD
ncbi:MAG: hypothetical protein II875_10725 [Clostridia bacterium]|nr:hypothetical protein [Clostridia bacterium]